MKASEEATRWTALGRVLTVVCIVAIGALLVYEVGIYGPAARDAGRATACRVGLRQLGWALQMYAQDNGGWGPTIAAEAKRIANDSGVPAGSVLTFVNEQGKSSSTGLGRLFWGGYLSGGAGWRIEDQGVGKELLYCDGVRGSDKTWVDAFSCDMNDRALVTRRLGPADGDGVGELPGNPDVMLSSYVLRYRTDNEWGATYLEDPKVTAIICDLFFFGEPGAVRSHKKGVRNILFTDGNVRVFEDKDGRVARVCKDVGEEEIEEVLDRTIFGEHFDPMIGVPAENSALE